MNLVIFVVFKNYFSRVLDVVSACLPFGNQKPPPPRPSQPPTGASKRAGVEPMPKVVFQKDKFPKNLNKCQPASVAFINEHWPGEPNVAKSVQLTRTATSGAPTRPKRPDEQTLNKLYVETPELAVGSGLNAKIKQVCKFFVFHRFD